jgi:FkbM family methyltransferase
MVLASGDYGDFEGPDWDRVVFTAYRESGTWSPALVALIVELLGAEGGTLIDVGANLGLVAIPVAERSRAHCIAFEPEPRNQRWLAGNVARHGLCERIELHEIALDARSGELELELSPDNSGDHRLTGEGSQARVEARIRVRTERLDDVIGGRALARPCVMKLDTQGADGRVLRGAAGTLPQVDYLIVEYYPLGLLRNGDRAEALQALLSSHFARGALLDQAGGPPQLVPIAALWDSLRWVATDGSDPGFFDLLLARAPAREQAGR